MLGITLIVAVSLFHLSESTGSCNGGVCLQCSCASFNVATCPSSGYAGYNFCSGCYCSTTISYGFTNPGTTSCVVPSCCEDCYTAAVTAPTMSPTNSPTNSPSRLPSLQPTRIPTVSPTTPPSALPTSSPSFLPTFSPSFLPTFSPSSLPTFAPSEFPTSSPSSLPTSSPSGFPTSSPSNAPTVLIESKGDENTIRFVNHWTFILTLCLVGACVLSILIYLGVRATRSNSKISPSKNYAENT